MNIQHIALLIYRLALVHIHKQITINCFKSGTGTLHDNNGERQSLDRCVWPMVIKTALANQQRSQPATTVEMNVQDQQIAYEKLTTERLQQLNVKTERYEQELNGKKETTYWFYISHGENDR